MNLVSKTYGSDNSHYIFTAIQDGDRLAFKWIYENYFKRLCIFSNGFIHDIETAKEIVQDTLLNLWEKRKDIIIKTSFESYLYTSVRNNSMNYLKRQQIEERYKKHLQNSHVINNYIYEDSIVRNELIKNIEKAIDELPEKCKTALIMSRFEGLKYKEIADKTGVSVKSIEYNIKTALKILSEKLKIFLLLLIAAYIIL